MELIRFELKKVFSNRFFLGILVFAVFLNLFTLYQSRNSGDFSEEKSAYNTYDEFLNSVKENAEQSLSISIFSDSLSDFSKKNIEKTAADFEKMQGIEITSDKNGGVMMLLDFAVSDLCFLLLLISAGLSLIVTEKEKKLFNLIRSTKEGIIHTFLAKLGALFIICFFINAVITATTAGYAFFACGFGDLSRSIQSVPELIMCYVKLSVREFILMFFSVKTLGLFAVGTVILLCCLFAKRAITMLVSVFSLASLSFAMTFIPETSKFSFFKYINLYSLLNPYEIFRSYVNLNIFGEPVNVITVFGIFLFLISAAAIIAATIYYVKKRPLENSDKKSVSFSFKSKVHTKLWFFEVKKILAINKGAVIILLFLLLQIYSVFNQVNFQSTVDYYYKHYMEMLAGPLTEEKEKIILSEKAKINEAEEKIYTLNEQRRQGKISIQEFVSRQEKYSETLEKADMFNKVYEKYLYVKETPGSEFIYDSGYEKLFGISDRDFSAVNTILLLSIFSLLFCCVYSSDYKNDMYRIICAAKYGTDKTRKVKTGVTVGLSVLIFLIAYIPELIYIGRFYGFDGIVSKLINIPSLAYFSSLPIWFAVFVLYALRLVVFLMLIPIISAVSLKTKNNVTAAIISLLIFAVPIGIYYAFHIEFWSKFSLWDLFSGAVLINEGSVYLFIVEMIILGLFSVLSRVYVKSKFGKSET